MEVSKESSYKPASPGNTQADPTLPFSASLAQSLPASQQTAPIATSSTSNKDAPMTISSDDGLKGTSADKMEFSPVPSKSALLQRQIQALEYLRTRMTSIRGISAHLIILHAQSPLISFGGLSGLALGGGNGTSNSDAINSILNADAGTEVPSQARELGLQARVAFRMLNDAREELLKDSTQDALKVAHSSEVQDKSEIALTGRRTRKKRRIATADSPAPFPSFHVETVHVFPPPRPEDRNITDHNDLILFIQEYNRKRADASKTRLGVWMPSRPKSGTARHVSDPLTVRVSIRDVTTVFIKLRHPGRDAARRQLLVDSVVALGPREKKGPYSDSDFTVYQKLTQYIVRMLEKEPNAFLAQVVDLLTSYEDLFITHCSICERVLPLEGHVPPVGRIWKENSITVEGERGRWEARHISCLHA